jgi:hypothetical protein
MYDNSYELLEAGNSESSKLEHVNPIIRLISFHRYRGEDFQGMNSYTIRRVKPFHPQTAKLYKDPRNQSDQFLPQDTYRAYFRNICHHNCHSDPE